MAMVMNEQTYSVSNSVRDPIEDGIVPVSWLLSSRKAPTSVLLKEIPILSGIVPVKEFAPR